MNYLTDSPPILRDFLVYMETIMGRAPGTVNQYFLDLRIFFRFLLVRRGLAPRDAAFEEISIDGIDQGLIATVTRSEVLDFLLFSARELPQHHKSPETSFGNTAKTRARKMASLRGFYKYCCEKMRLFDENPTTGVDIPKQKKDLPKFLTLNESLNLLNAVEGPYAQRDYCILTLFLNCGMRVSELVGISLGDISENQLRVVGKGNKERIVYLNDACRSAIEGYLPFRLTPKPAHRSALFISREGNRINVQTVKWLVKKYLGQAGLGQKKLSVHKLRHTAATLMYQNGVDVRTLKEVLGHENLDTTMIYTHVIDDNLRQAAEMNPLGNQRKRFVSKSKDDPEDV